MHEMAGIDKNFVNTYIKFKADGLDASEISKLKTMAATGQIDPEAAKQLATIISKDHIDKSDKQLLILLGESAKDLSTVKKFEKSIDPSNDKINKLIEAGFKTKSTSSSTKVTTVQNVESMSTKQKITEALKKTLKYVPENIREKVAGLLTPENIGIMAGTMAVWAGSHVAGVGEVADAALTGIAIATLGKESIGVVKDFYHFAKIAHSAKSDTDLENAAQQLAHGISTVLVDSAAIALTKKGMSKPPGKITFEGNPVFALPGSGTLLGAPAFSVSASTGAATSATAAGVMGGPLLMAKHRTTGKVTNATSGRGHVQVKPKDVKALQEGGKGTVVSVKTVAEAEALVKKAFPNFKEMEAFGSIDSNDLSHFPVEVRNVIEKRWKINPLETNTINKSDKQLLRDWGKKNNKSIDIEKFILGIELRWHKSFQEFKNNGNCWHKDYNIKDHPVNPKNGHGMYPHINIRTEEGINLEIRITGRK